MKLQYEDKLIIGLVILMILFIWLASGCTSKQVRSEATYANGCYFHVVGLSTKQAEILRDRFTTEGMECDVSLSSTAKQEAEETKTGEATE